MKKRKAYTLIELLVIMGVIAILVAVISPAFKGMQDEAKRARIQKDLRVIGVALESYYKNHKNMYPAEADYQATLIIAVPWVMDHNINDPFGATSATLPIYSLCTGDPNDSFYYIVYSVGVNGNGAASVNNVGTVTASNSAIWYSNGHI